MYSKYICMRVAIVVFPAPIYWSLHYYYLTSTSFNYNAAPLFFGVWILAVIFFGLAMKKILRLRQPDGFWFLAASLVIVFSFNPLVKKEVRYYAAKQFVQKNKLLVAEIKSSNIEYYLDSEKEGEALFFDAERELSKAAPSTDWLNRHRSFKDCRYWAIPLEKDFYIVSFNC